MSRSSYLADYDPADYAYDDTSVVLTARMLERLDEYSTTMPTAPRPGRIWKRNGAWHCRRGGPDWWVVVVDVIPNDPAHLAVKQRRVLEVIP
jgi:hypothetical protein